MLGPHHADRNLASELIQQEAEALSEMDEEPDVIQDGWRPGWSPSVLARRFQLTRKVSFKVT